MSTPLRPIEGRPPRADALRRARIEAGLRQHELAALAVSRRSGGPIDQTTIAKYETGRWPLTEERLAYLLGVIAAAGRTTP